MLLPVIVPVLFWAWYHYHKDRHLPEPAGHLLLAFVLGIAAAAISKLMYIALGPLGLRYDAFALAATSPAGLFAYAMLAIGPIEELAKFLPFAIIVTRFREFDERIDGIIYASFIGLGYAAVENIVYLQVLTLPEAAARGFAGPVVHMLFASIWGYLVAEAMVEGRSVAIAATVGLVAAAALHGLYDFIVLLDAGLSLPIAAAIIGVAWVWRLRLLRALHLEARRGAPSE